MAFIELESERDADGSVVWTVGVDREIEVALSELEREIEAVVALGCTVDRECVVKFIEIEGE